MWLNNCIGNQQDSASSNHHRSRNASTAPSSAASSPFEDHSHQPFGSNGSSNQHQQPQMYAPSPLFVPPGQYGHLAQDPRLFNSQGLMHAQGVMPHTDPGQFHLGAAGPSGYLNSAPPPGLVSQDQRRRRRAHPTVPPVLQRIPQVDPRTQPIAQQDLINPMWTHVYPPSGAAAHGHPTHVKHDLHHAVTVKDPSFQAKSSRSASRGSNGRSVPPPPGLPIPVHVMERGRSYETEEQGVELPPFPLDKYAPTYVPQWLKQLPEPRAIFTLPAPPLCPLPDYAADLLPRKLLSNPPFPHDIESSLLFDPPISSKVHVRPLDNDRMNTEGSYNRHFSTLLALALEGDAARLHSAAIYKACLVLHDNKSAVELENRTYRLTIPGIIEDFPRLQVGDVVILRGLSQVNQTGTYELLEARVTGMIKIKGWVFISAPLLGRFDMDVEKGVDPETVEENGALYNVTFMASTGEACTMQNSVRTFGSVLDQEIRDEVAQDCSLDDSPLRGIAHRWLFPLPEDVNHTEARETKRVRFLDPLLNQEQMKAVLSIAHLSHGVPYIISGPPGTGKTRTLVEGVLQILHADPGAKILVVAPSNPAADTLASRLAKHLSRKEMLRLCSPERTFAEVPTDVLPYCFVEDNHFSLPPAEDVLAHRVIVSNCLDASLLVNARLSNLDLMRAEHTLFSTLHRAENSVLRPHWTHLLVNEAAQGTEPAVLIPMSVVLPYSVSGRSTEKTPVIVLVGDCHQLGPVITSSRAREAEFDTSLLERLINRQVYAVHDQVGNSYENNHSDRLWCSITNLVQNYRSIAPILMVPSSLFYEDQLVASADNVELLPWQGLPNPSIPIAFIGCETEEECIEDGASWYNDGEIIQVVKTVQSLLNGSLGNLQHDQVAVITPWREQTWRIRAALRSRRFRDVNVGDVESYQGAEYRVTILSCVRSRMRFVEADKAANMGFINEPKRFNVAITRAKELLILIGNANLLKTDPYWQGFLQVCLRNNLYVGPPLGLEMTGAYLSRLESQIKASRPDPFADLGLLLSAELAREVLHE